ncbi:hypothetical protein [Aeromonas veronii]|uniref:Uncharacterized protein n=1 Tax=Aeromonas veronii TaxID=654 RepID=A0AAW5MA07_AERVE|nr:hypothetical protein [Aeromonas veronii]MCR4450813.1 hypothetical protein [Aeromonas veronii]
MSHQQLIDEWVNRLLEDSALLRDLQRDLLDLRKDGPHGQRTPAKTHLTLCRLARRSVKAASSKVRSLHIGGAI